jgi:thiol:disulfide interchange protein
MRSDRFRRLRALAIVPALMVGFACWRTPTRADDAAAPAKKDSAAAIKPKSAVLSTSVDPAEAKPGETVTFKVTAKLDPGFHIYKYSKEQGPGPINTTFDFFDPAGLKIDGDWTASSEPLKKKDPNFADLDTVEFYEDEITWSIKLKVPADAVPGDKALRCQARYMVCDDKTCSIPGRWTLPDATVKIVAGGAPAPKSAAPTPNTSNPAPKSPSGAAASQTSDAKNVIDAPAKAAPASPVAAAPRPSDSATGLNGATPAAGIPADPAKSPAPVKSGSDKAASEPPGAAGVQSEIAETAQAGLLPFLFASALGGLFALVMPCVWPMVPITVNFFVKQGQGKEGRGKATTLAFIYCLSIIGVFTAVGVLFSVFFSASSLQTLANNPWLNLFVAALFVTFGLSLLGLFEIRLPSFLLNASSQQESRGGLIGVVFMALTLTITSFTCTFPVVGGLLVMAAGGDYLYPIIGLATFATVLAFPFLLLALSPGLISRMPRSGDWMNAIKVVGGLVEIGAALKFLNTAELARVVPEDAWFDAHVVLTCWIALSLICGLYLLGVFKTEHDHGDVKVGSIRIVSAALFLGLAIYMTPALFGRPPQSMVWDRLIIGLLPPDATEFRAPEQLAGNGGDSTGSSVLRNVNATSTEPAQAEREEKRAHGVLWGMSLEQAQELAKTEKKPILIDFTGENCSNCRLMENQVLPRPEVVALLKKFVTVELYTDFVPIRSLNPDQREELATQNQTRLLKLAKEATNPIYVVLSPDGQVLGRLGGYNAPNVFVDFLTRTLDKLPPDMKVAQAGGAAKSSEDRGSRE